MNKDHPYYDESMWKGAPKQSFIKAKELRKNMTEAESLLWDRLKSNKLRGYKFRRQHPIHIYIVDFYCHCLKLVIEVDGDYHLDKEQKLKDQNRTKVLNYQGISVIRFTNHEIENNLEKVIKDIEDKITELKG